MSSAEPSIFRRQPKQSRSQAKVDAILQAAAAVFWEVGYEAATTHSIAKRAGIAVGTLYRFFPNKLAIFHALERQHRLDIEAIHANLMTPEFVQQSLSEMIKQTVETYAEYFEALGPRVVYTQYYIAPEMFVHFDEAVEFGFVQRFAIAMRMRNPRLSIEESELISEVCHRSFNAIFVCALKSEPERRAKFYRELQTVIIGYLGQYMPEVQSVVSSNASIALEPTNYRLNLRQQKVLDYLTQHEKITIQDFEVLCPERSRRTLQRDLTQLVKQQLLRREGDTTQLTYCLRSN